MKKVLICALALSIVFSTSACGKKANESASAPSETPLDYWCKLETVHRTSVSTLGDLDFYKAVQEKTGVKVNFIHPPAGQEMEQFNLMISSRDYPDIIESGWMTMSGGPEKAIQDKIILPLNEIVDKYAPNYKKVLEENELVRKAFYTDEGNLYSFGPVSLKSDISVGGLMIRRDWLKDLGLESPTSLEEWENVLKRFKEEKGAEAPFSVDKERMESVMLFSDAFGIGSSFYVDGDNHIKYGPAQPEYKEYLQLMNKWFTAGYIDNGLFTNTSNIVEAKVLNSQSGAFFGYVGSVMGRLFPAATDDKFDIVGVTIPSVKTGEPATPYTSGVKTDKGGYGYGLVSNAALSTTNKNIEASAKLLDFLYTDEGKMLKLFGTEGKTYNMVNGKPVYTDLITHDTDGLPVADAMGKYFRATYPSPGFINDENYFAQYYTYPQQTESVEIFSSDIDKAVAFGLPPISPTADEANEVSTLVSTINTYKNEMFAKFVMGTEPISNYDKYLETLESMQLQKVLDIYSEAIKRYEKR